SCSDSAAGSAARARSDRARGAAPTMEAPSGRRHEAPCNRRRPFSAPRSGAPRESSTSVPARQLPSRRRSAALTQFPLLSSGFSCAPPPKLRYCSGSAATGFQLLLASSMARRSTTSLAMTVREHDAALGGLIRANPLAILVVDAHDRVQMVNPAFEALFGFREAELVGHPIEAFIVPRDRTAEAAGLSRRGFEGRSARSVTQRRRKDGSLVDIDLTVVPL